MSVGVDGSAFLFIEIQSVIITGYARDVYPDVFDLQGILGRGGAAMILNRILYREQ
jgi:hypothetical protein